MSDLFRYNKSSSPLRLFFWFLLLAAFLFNFYPVIRGLVANWSYSDEASHGFFIFPIALYIVWSKKEALSRHPVKSSWAGLLFIVISLLLFVGSRLAEILTAASFSMVLFLVGLVLFLFGWRVLKELSFPLFLLLFMIPVPSQIYSVATIPLQLFVSKAAATLASMAGVSVFRQGNVLSLPGHTLEVVQACSGLRSLTALLTLALIFGYFSLKRNILRFLLVVAAVPVAVAVNIVRVFLMLLALYYFNFNLTEGGIHTVYGLVIFILALLLLMLVRKLLLFWDVH